MSESVFLFPLLSEKLTPSRTENAIPPPSKSNQKEGLRRETLFTKHVPSPGIEPGFKV